MTTRHLNFPFFHSMTLGDVFPAWHRSLARAFFSFSGLVASSLSVSLVFFWFVCTATRDALYFGPGSSEISFIRRPWHFAFTMDMFSFSEPYFDASVAGCFLTYHLRGRCRHR
jgi:hypothetical protein